MFSKFISAGGAGGISSKFQRRILLGGGAVYLGSQAYSKLTSPYQKPVVFLNESHNPNPPLS